MINKYIPMLLIITSYSFPIFLDAQYPPELFETSTETLTLLVQTLQLQHLVKDAGVPTIKIPRPKGKVRMPREHRVEAFDHQLEHFLVKASHTEVFETSLTIDNLQRRLAALSVVLTVNASQSPNFVETNADPLMKIILNTYAHTYKPPRGTSSKTFKTEQLFIAGCLRPIARVFSRQLLNNPQEFGTHCKDHAKIYFFITLAEQPDLRDVFITQTTFDGENFEFFCSPTVKTSTEYIAAQNTILNPQNHYQPFFNFVDGFLQNQTETDIPHIAHDIWNLGLLFFLCPHTFHAIRTAIENESSNPTLAQECKLFWANLIRFILNIQNRIEKKPLKKTMLRAYLNSVLMIILNDNFLQIRQDDAPTLATSTETTPPPFLHGLYILIELFVKKNILEMRRHERNMAQLTWAIVGSIANISLAVSLGFTGVFPVSLLAGTSALFASIIGGRTWDKLQELATGQPETAEINRIKTQLAAQVSTFIKEIGSHSEASETEASEKREELLGQLKDATVLYISRMHWGYHGSRESELTELVLGSSTKTQELSETQKLSIMLKAAFDRIKRLEERMNDLERQQAIDL